MHSYALSANKKLFLKNHIYNSSKTLRVVSDLSTNNILWEKLKKTEMHAERLCIHALEDYCLHGNSSQICRFNAIPTKIRGIFTKVDKLILNDSMKCKRPRINRSEKEKKNTHI